MTICFTGSHGTGKTTLARAISPGVNRLAKDKGLKPFSLVVDTTRKALEAFEDAFKKPVNEATIVGFRLNQLGLTGDNVISDRTVLEPVIYAAAYNSLDDQTFYLLTQLAFWSLKKTINCLFYLPVAINLIDDGVRPADPAFQVKIDKEIINWLGHVQVPYVSIQSITLEERVEEVISHLTTVL